MVDTRYSTPRETTFRSHQCPACKRTCPKHRADGQRNAKARCNGCCANTTAEKTIKLDRIVKSIRRKPRKVVAP